MIPRADSAKCGGELNKEYIEEMGDIPSIYEGPFSAAQAVVCLDEKPVWLNAEYPAACICIGSADCS